jgi:hypothetical protein
VFSRDGDSEGWRLPDVAYRLEVSMSTLRRRIARGEIRAFIQTQRRGPRYSVKRLYVSQAELERPAAPPGESAPAGVSGSEETSWRACPYCPGLLQFIAFWRWRPRVFPAGKNG